MLKKYPLFALPVRNGILGGILGTVLIISLFFLHLHPFLIPGILDFRIFLFPIMLIFILKEYRDFYGNGSLSFWEGMIMSFSFILSFAIVTFLTLWVFGLADPDFVTSYISLTEEHFKLFPPPITNSIQRGQFNYYMNTTLPSTTAIYIAWLFFWQNLPGILPSIILSLILRRQPKTQSYD
jgi:hypothetical protein